MSRKLQIRRGLSTDLPSLAQGEFGLALDTDKLYIGGNSGNIQVNGRGGGSGLGIYEPGDEWHLTATNPATYESVCFGNGMFVAVASRFGSSSYSGYAWYSTDGRTWKMSGYTPNKSWKSICYGNDKFVALGDGSNDPIAYNTTANIAKSWTGVSTTDIFGNEICYGDGKFVIIGGGRVHYSLDLEHWETVSLANIVPGSYYTLCYGGGKFIALGYNSPQTTAIISEDAINWDIANIPALTGGNANYYSICYGNGIYVAVNGGQNNPDNSNCGCAYSLDGINWLPYATGIENPVTAVCHGNGKFIATAGNQNVIYVSSDGAHWHATDIPPGTQSYYNAACYGDGKFVLLSQSNGYALYSGTVSEIFYTADYHDLNNKPKLNRAATLVIGTETQGHTLNDCDYLCDGVTDDTEINNALKALPANGGKIVIREGTYNISQQIIVDKPNVTIEGMGTSTILLRGFSHAGSIATVAGLIHARRSHTTNANLFIDGNKRTYPAAGINFGISFEVNSDYNTISNNYITNNSGYCVYGESNFNTISHNVCLDSKDGICLAKGNNNQIKNNVCSNHTNCGISFGNNTVSNNIAVSVLNDTVTGNFCSNNTVDGIYCNYGNNALIANNICTGNKNCGINLTGKITTNVVNNGKDNVVANNILLDNAVYGIYLFACNNTVVDGNYIFKASYASSQYPIRITGINNFITSNSAIGGAINNAGTNNTLSENKLT